MSSLLSNILENDEFVKYNKYFLIIMFNKTGNFENYGKSEKF